MLLQQPPIDIPANAKTGKTIPQSLIATAPFTQGSLFFKNTVCAAKSACAKFQSHSKSKLRLRGAEILDDKV